MTSSQLTPDPLAPRPVGEPVVPDAPAEVREEARHDIVGPSAKPAGRGLFVLGLVGIVLLSLAALAVLAYLVGGLGVGVFAVGGILALVPLTFVLLGVRWIDRWEPEPRAAIVFAFLWGAGVAVLIALLVGAEIQDLVASVGVDAAVYDFVGSVVQAPIVEEGGKGLGVLLLFLFARKHFDGPVDGLVYAAVVAGGFAFTENILYFGQSLTEGGAAYAAQTFFVRGLMSPFAHVMFTACTGIALGLAARRTGALGAIGFFVVGLIPAVLLHALWNGSLYIVQDFFGYYAVVQFPLFLLFIWIVIYLRRKESQVTRARLTEYAASGWFNPGEVDALATGPGRRTTMAWARQHGVAAAMKLYIRDSTRLAFARQRMMAGRSNAAAQADEAVLLAAIVASRRIISGTPTV